jgi:hypothetical protein
LLRLLISLAHLPLSIFFFFSSLPTLSLVAYLESSLTMIHLCVSSLGCRKFQVCHHMMLISLFLNRGWILFTSCWFAVLL